MTEIEKDHKIKYHQFQDFMKEFEIEAVKFGLGNLENKINKTFEDSFVKEKNQYKNEGKDIQAAKMTEIEKDHKIKYHLLQDLIEEFKFEPVTKVDFGNLEDKINKKFEDIFAKEEDEYKKEDDDIKAVKISQSTLTTIFRKHSQLKMNEGKDASIGSYVKLARLLGYLSLEDYAKKKEIPFDDKIVFLETHQFPQSELDRMGVKFAINTEEDIDKYFNDPDDYLFEGKRFLLGWYPLKYSLIESVDANFEFKVVESKGTHKKAGETFWIPTFLYLSENDKDYLPDIMINDEDNWFSRVNNDESFIYEGEDDLSKNPDYFYL